MEVTGEHFERRRAVCTCHYACSLRVVRHAVFSGTIGLEVSFGAFLAVILGLFIPVVFLVTLFIQSDAQGTATSFRQPDSIGGTRYEDE